MSKSIYPSIPAPGTDLNSMRATVSALQQAVTLVIMNAQSPNPNFTPSSAAQVFVTKDELKAGGLVGDTGPAGPQGPPGPGIAEAPNDVNTYGRHALAWVPVTGGGLADAPNDGTQYGRQSAAWTPVASPYVLPTASTTVLGGVKVDGSTITVASGVISSAGGGASVTVAATAPSSPSVGALWFDTNGGQMYVWYNDGSSAQWVPVANQGSSGSMAGQQPWTSPPALGTWTQLNAGVNTTFTTTAAGLTIYDKCASTTNALRLLSRAAPAPPYMIDANINAFALNAGTFPVGIGWSDGTKIQWLLDAHVAGSANIGTWVSQVATVNSAPAVNGTQWSLVDDQGNLWMRLYDDGTNVSFWRSGDGYTWLQVYTVTKAAGFLGSSGYTNLIFGLDGGAIVTSAQAHVSLRSWRVH